MIGLGLLLVVAMIVAAVAAGHHQGQVGMRAGTAGGQLSMPLGQGKLRRAVEKGIITEAQAEAIEAIEAPPAPSEPGPARPGPTVTPVIEILGYLGALLALLGATILVSQFWDDLESWSRLLLLGTVAVALLGAGLAVREEGGDDATLRLRGFLLLLSTAATAGFTGLLGADVLDWSPEAVTQLVGATVAVHAGTLWARQATRPAQHLATFGGLLALVTATAARLDDRELTSAAVFVLSSAWLLGGWRRWLPPTFAAEALGGFGMLAGCAVLAGSQMDLALVAGLVTSAGLLAAGVRGGRPVMSAAGVLGILGFLPSAVTEWFGDTAGVPLALLAVGGILLAITIRLLRRNR